MAAESGLRWYVGSPGCGKTTRALADAIELVAETGYPLVALDSAAVDQLAVLPAASSVEELIAAVWERGFHRRLVPRDQSDVERLLAACYAAGRVVLLVDESAFWLTSRRGTQSWLLRMMRSHRHARLWLLLTTQHLSGDVPQEALACSPEMLVGRLTAPAGLEVVARRYGADPRVLTTLPVGTFLRVDLDHGAGMVSHGARSDAPGEANERPTGAAEPGESEPVESGS